VGDNSLSNFARVDAYFFFSASSRRFFWASCCYLHLVQGRQRAQMPITGKAPRRLHRRGLPRPWGQGGVTLSRTHQDKRRRGPRVPAYSSSELISGRPSRAEASTALRHRGDDVQQVEGGCPWGRAGHEPVAVVLDLMEPSSARP
jgi:hypothetical protein